MVAFSGGSFPIDPDLRVDPIGGVNEFIARRGILADRFWFMARDPSGRFVDVGGRPVPPVAQFHAAQFYHWAAHPDFVCLGALATMRLGTYRIAYCDAELGSPEAAVAIGLAATQFIDVLPEIKGPFRPLIVLFAASPQFDSSAYHEAWWNTMQIVSDLDSMCYPHATDVEADPKSPRFGLSIGGRGWFPNCSFPAASLVSRRTLQPSLILNLQSNFDALKVDGQFASIHEKNAERQLRLQGVVNPYLANLGDDADQAAQVTSVPGRCPFRRVSADVGRRFANLFRCLRPKDC